MNLILLPGLDGTGDLFAPLLAHLNPNINSIVVAYPNNGAQDYASLTSFALAKIPQNAPFVVLGESFSGPVAIEIASQNVHCKGLILAASFARNPKPNLSKLSFLLHYLPPNNAMFLSIGMPFIKQLVMQNIQDVNLHNSLQAALGKASSQTIKARLSQVISVDVTQKLSQIRLPILYLQAQHDRLVPPSAFALIAQFAPQTVLKSLHAPHLMLQIAHAEAAIEIEQFISQLID